MAREIKTCSESKVTHTRIVMPAETNTHNTLFGGTLMAEIDKAASIAFVRHGRYVGSTASIDSLNFIRPLPQSHSVTIETMVSGVGRSSAEIFAKVIGEDLLTGERYLAGTAFLTFVAFKDENGQARELPGIQPETEEERFICRDYEIRRKHRLATKEFDQAFNQQLKI